MTLKKYQRGIPVRQGSDTFSELVQIRPQTSNKAIPEVHPRTLKWTQANYEQSFIHQLPPEIRDMIWQEIILDIEIRQKQCAKNPGALAKSPSNLYFLLACRLIFIEVSRRAFAIHNFVLRGFPLTPAEIGLRIGRLSIPSRELITQLTFSGIYQGRLDHLLCRSMVNFSNLRSVTIFQSYGFQDLVEEIQWVGGESRPDSLPEWSAPRYWADRTCPPDDWDERGWTDEIFFIWRMKSLPLRIIRGENPQ